MLALAGGALSFFVVLCAPGGDGAWVGERRARAQTPPASPPTLVDADARLSRGVFIPDGARSGEADATAVELNPAQLGFLRASSADLVIDAWRRDVAMPGRGAGLFWGAPLWAGNAIGLGLEGSGGSSSTAASAAAQLGVERTKFQLAYALAGRHLSLGATWAHLWGGAASGLDTFDVGAGLRLGDRVALGLVLEDATRPNFITMPPPLSGLAGTVASLDRRWVGEVTLRPLGTDRLNLAAAAIHVGADAWSGVAWRFRAAARVSAAGHLFGDVEWGPRPLDPVAGSGLLVAGPREPRVTVGLTLDLDHGGLVVAGRRARVPDGGSGAGWGGALAWHYSGEQNPHALEPAQIVRVRLHDLEGDRRFVDLMLALRAMAYDDGVAGVLLEIEALELGMGRIEELRDAVAELRRHEKPVLAALSTASIRELYLAAACDRIVVHPAGTLTFAGFSQSVTFYKGAMERLGVRVELVRIAEFKGAMEPYVLEEQSEPVRRNRNALLDDVFTRVGTQIAVGRRWESARRAPSYIDQLLDKAAFTPEEARRSGLVDAVLDRYDQEAYLRDWLGRPVTIRNPDDSPVRPERWSRARVAVILVDGAINSGDSQPLPLGLGILAGEDSLVSALDRCRRDGTVRAVVLRINSPGGSAYASDVIARAVAKLRASGKPVIASMGDVAASGGYYVAAPADEIFAEPSTTTGSIGIFGFKVDASRLLSMLSLHTETTRRGAHADELSPARPWTDEERKIAEDKIRYMYGLFLKTVADGRRARGMTVARANEIGRGHVWTGAQARDIGLVDRLGGVTAAIEAAARGAGLARAGGELPELLILPRPSSGLVQKLIGLSELAEASSFTSTTPTEAAAPMAAAMTATMTATTPVVRAALRWIGPYLFGASEGIDARLPFDWEIR